MILRKLVPYSFRLKFKIFKRILHDYKNGKSKLFSTKTTINKEFKHKIELTQHIRNSHLSKNKIENLKLASQKIKQVIIKPNEIFSFWKIIENPTTKNGFLKGRNIVNGKLCEDIGGGLCQISGIMYHISLLANLKIVERFNHTIDIYTDETRFTPLGADATVVYGFKDLRILNNYNFDIRFNFAITNNSITAFLESEQPINENNINFKSKIINGKIMVNTFNDDDVISASEYLVG